MKCRHRYAEGTPAATLWTSISECRIPRRLLRFSQSKRLSVWTKVDTLELAPRSLLRGCKVYNSYKYFINPMKLGRAELALYKGEKASHRLWEAQYMITGRRHRKGPMRCEPAQIRPLALKQSRNRFDQYWRRGTLSDATRVTQGQDPLHPALALLAMGPLAAFVPPETASVDALRDGLGRFSTLDIHNTHSDAPSRAKRWAHVPALSSRVVYWWTSQRKRAYRCSHRSPLQAVGASSRAGPVTSRGPGTAYTGR
jgi:hypothetical protein